MVCPKRSETHVILFVFPLTLCLYTHIPLLVKSPARRAGLTLLLISLGACDSWLYLGIWCLANQRRRISQRKYDGGGFYPHIPLCVHEKEEGSNWEGGWGIGWDSSIGGESRIIPPPSREHLYHHFVEPQDGFLGFFLPMPRKFSRLSLPSTKKPNFEGAREKRKITKCALSNHCAGIGQMCH